MYTNNGIHFSTTRLNMKLDKNFLNETKFDKSSEVEQATNHTESYYREIKYLGSKYIVPNVCDYIGLDSTGAVWASDVVLSPKNNKEYEKNGEILIRVGGLIQKSVIKWRDSVYEIDTKQFPFNDYKRFSKDTKLPRDFARGGNFNVVSRNYLGLEIFAPKDMLYISFDKNLNVWGYSVRPTNLSNDKHRILLGVIIANPEYEADIKSNWANSLVKLKLKSMFGVIVK